MNRMWGAVLAVLVSSTIAACEKKKDLNDEIDDVVKAQQEAAEQVEETPSDTAEIRRKAEKVIEEQRDVQKVVPESVARQNVPRMIPSTTTSQ